MPISNYDTLHDKQLLIHPGRVPANAPGLFFGSDYAELFNPEGKGSVLVSRTDGVSLAGPLSIQTAPDTWRVFGLWKVNPLSISCIPSTVFTPHSWLRPVMPRTPVELMKGITSVVSMLAGFI